MRNCFASTLLAFGVLACGACTDAHRTNPKIAAGAAGTGAGLPRDGSMNEEVRGTGSIPGPGPNGAATSMSGSTGTVATAMANPGPGKQIAAPTAPAPVTGAPPVRPQEH